MAFDDDGYPVFPTRTGVIGTALENRMLGAAGVGTIKTSMKSLPDGTTVRLRTRNGMPEFVIDIDKRQICPIEYGPITEDVYANREMWSPYVKFSIDGLYSITVERNKTIDVLLPAGVYRTTSNLCFAAYATDGTLESLSALPSGLFAASVESAAQAVETSDFIESSRTFASVKSAGIDVSSVRAIAFLSDAALKDLVFERNTCAERTLTLTFYPEVEQGSGKGPISGAYSVSNITSSAGPTTNVVLTNNAQRVLEINLGGSDGGAGGFIDPMSVDEESTLGTKVQWLSASEETIHRPMISTFAPPFRGFASADGIFTDETKTARNGLAKKYGVTKGGCAGGLLVPARYVNFGTGKDPQAIPGYVNAELLNDACFNVSYMDASDLYFNSSVGMDSHELRHDETLYKDTTGAVWKLRFLCAPGATTDTISAFVVKRFDRIYRNDPEIWRSLGEFESQNEGNNPLTEPGTPLYRTGAMQVLSTPDGKIVGLTLYSAGTTTGLVSVTLTDMGAGDGSDILAEFSQIESWIASTSAPDLTPITDEDFSQTVETFEASDGSGISGELVDVSGTDSYWPPWSIWFMAQPSGTTCGPVHQTRTYTSRYRYHQNSTAEERIRYIELRPTLENTIEPVRSTWRYTVTARYNRTIYREQIVDTTSFVLDTSSATWSVSGEGEEIKLADVIATSISEISFNGRAVTAEITLNYGTQTTTPNYAAMNPGYDGSKGLGRLSNTRIETGETVDATIDTIAGDFLPYSTLEPDSTNHSHRAVYIGAKSSVYEPKIVELISGGFIEIAKSAESMFGGCTFGSMLPSNEMDRVCHDARNDRIFVADTTARAGYFY